MEDCARRVYHTDGLGIPLLAMLAAGWALGQPAAATSPSNLVRQYCVACHSARVKAGALVLENLDLAAPREHAAVWEKVVRKLGTGAMPPQGSPHPPQTQMDQFVAYLEGSLDDAAKMSPNPGRPVLNRLNRTQYGNAIRDFLDVTVDVSSLLPADDASFGFDNVGTGLGFSPALVESYVGAAAKISRLAVGEPGISASTETYAVRADLSQDRYLEGLPIGTRGGIVVQHNFPLDAEYSIKIGLARNTLGDVIGLDSKGEELEVAVNGERAATFVIEKKNADSLEVRLRIKAGPQRIIATFPQRNLGPADFVFQPFERTLVDAVDARGVPHLASVTIRGPYNQTGPGDTPSRRKIFVCRPAPGADEIPCAKQILSALARHAYRRPIMDKDLETLLSFYQRGRNHGDFDSGIQIGLQRILSSPEFILRFERDPADVAPGAAYRLGDLELASRLSFFLWSSIPDEELLALAERGRLRDPSIFDKQVRRMLADPRAQTLVTNFASQWLYLRNLPNAVPNIDLFPDFDDNLRQAFQRETELFFENVLREDRSVLDLLNGKDTFVNERLARHYGIPGIYGSNFRRITLSDPNRWGLLGKGSTLLVTSVADRTSPVARGKWVLINVIGTPPGAPPPGVPPLKENLEGSKPLSVRERMEAHRANAVCATCHRTLDPLGFALENYDATGKWRTISEAGEKIDASGTLFNGLKVDGPASLREALAGRPDVFLRTMTEQLMIYAMGRGLDAYDMPTVRQILRDSAPGDYRFSALILGIAKSVPFQMRTSSEPEAAPARAVARK